MAEFEKAFEKMIRNEGGYKLHKVPGDRGGMTYAGISKKFHPKWPGWAYIDNGDREDPELTGYVKSFYLSQFWEKIRGDEINSQSIAETLFDFSVNAGHRTAVKISQLIIDSTPDGIVGPNTLEKLNQSNPDDFILKYSIGKVARYAEIVNKDRSQGKFLLGWINRTLRGISS